MDYEFENEIVLYVLSIEEYARKNKLSAPEVFEEVFIHELFHAYHYNDKDEELLERNDYTSKVVKESLASFFECFYCYVNKISNYKLVTDSWKANNVYRYPYSGAKHWPVL